MIAQHNIKTADDAAELASKIYKLFFKTKQDSSASNDMGKLEKMIQKALDEDTVDLKKKAQDLQKSLRQDRKRI